MAHGSLPVTLVTRWYNHGGFRLVFGNSWTLQQGAASAVVEFDVINWQLVVRTAPSAGRRDVSVQLTLTHDKSNSGGAELGFQIKLLLETTCAVAAQ